MSIRESDLESDGGIRPGIQWGIPPGTLAPLRDGGYLRHEMLFNLGDKEILIIIGVLVIVTVGLSGLAALSMGGLRRLWRRRRKGDGRDQEQERA